MAISNEQLLYLLEERGYEIAIREDKDSKHVSFRSTTGYPWENCAHYSTEFTNNEVRLDCVWKLLKWTGLRITYTLDY